MSDLEVDVVILINMVEERPVLWDKTLEIYKDRNLTRDAWREIFCAFKSDFEELSEKEKNEIGKRIIGKWSNIRDNWMRSLKKIKDYKKSGAGGKPFKKYIYHDQLQFLAKVAEPMSTNYELQTEMHNNVTIKEEPEDISHNNSIDDNSHSSVVTSPKTTVQSTNIWTDRKRKRDDFETKLLHLLEKPEGVQRDPHQSFFDSILPSVSKFNEDDTLEFRMGVLNLIKSLKQRYRPTTNSSYNLYPAVSTQNPVHNSHNSFQNSFQFSLPHPSRRPHDLISQPITQQANSQYYEAPSPSASTCTSVNSEDSDFSTVNFNNL